MLTLTPQRDTRLCLLGLGLLALTTLVPLWFLESRPVDFIGPLDPLRAAAGYALVATALLGTVLFRALRDRRDSPSGAWVTLGLAGVAAVLTLLHWLEVDRNPAHAEWQREMYLGVFNGDASIPHRFRPLPYGFARLLERLTGDWFFSCLAYRWFFTFWFLWACYRLARRFHAPGRALLTVVPVVLLYPLAVMRYWGQLADPINHALFVLGMLCILEQRPVTLAAILFLGVLSKETIGLLVPAYFACWWKRDVRGRYAEQRGRPRTREAGRYAEQRGRPRTLNLEGWLATLALGLASVAAFLLARPGWRPGYGNINGTTGLMFGTNLGLGEPIARLGVPLYENYLHLLLFVGVFVPFLAYRWRAIDTHLRLLCLTVVPLVLLSNLAFGWAYESRNYLPLVPLLATAAMPETRSSKDQTPNSKLQTAGEARPT
jgi:hypothetical protein